MVDRNQAESMFQEAHGARENREFSKAVRLQQEGLELWGQEDSRFSLELEELAGLHYIQEKFDKAAVEYDRALGIWERAEPEDYAGSLRILYWLGKSRFKNEEYDLAETAMRRALDLAESKPVSPETLACSLYELGFLLYYVGRYPEAAPYLLKALHLFESAKGPSDPATIEVLERIALTYSCCPAIGEDPEPYFRRAVKAILPEGETRRVYIENLCRWAGYVADCGRFDDADPLFAELLSLISNADDLNDTDSFWIASDCVKYYQSRGKGDMVSQLLHFQDFDAYGQMVKKKLEHAEQTLADDDPELAEALFNSGNEALFKGEYEKAKALLGRALQAYSKINGEESEEVVHALCSVCVVNRQLGKFEESEAAVKRALDISRAFYTDRYVYPAALEDFALLREAEGKAADATELYENAAAEYERICGFPSREAVEALYRQGGFLLRIPSLGPAEEKIRRAISVVDQVESISDYEKSDYFGTLAEILEASGRKKESVEMKDRADALFQKAESESESE